MSIEKSTWNSADEGDDEIDSPVTQESASRRHCQPVGSGAVGGE